MPPETQSLWSIVLQGGAAGVLFLVALGFITGHIAPRWVLNARILWEKERDALWLAAVTARDTEIANLKNIIANYAAMTTQFTQVLTALAETQRSLTAVMAQIATLQSDLTAARAEIADLKSKRPRGDPSPNGTRQRRGTT